MSASRRGDEIVNLGEIKIEHYSIGLFDTEEKWIHPDITVSTYEIICVQKGVVHISEDGVEYSLEKNDLLLLDAEKRHFGFKYSEGRTSFFWVHFRCNDIEKLNISKVLRNFDEVDLFKELLHNYSVLLQERFYLDSICAHIIGKIVAKSAENVYSKIACDIFEWTRINANAKLHVSDIARHFRYSDEHVSRLIKKNYKVGLKQLINEFIIKKANNLLINDNFSIKEIADILGFENYNSFVKFYKYHQKISPTKYKNKYFNNILNNN